MGDYMPCESRYQLWLATHEAYKELWDEAHWGMEEYTSALDEALDQCGEYDAGLGQFTWRWSPRCMLLVLRAIRSFREAKERLRSAADAKDEAERMAEDLWQCIDDHAIAAGQVEYPVDLEPLPDEPDEPELEEV